MTSVIHLIVENSFIIGDETDEDMDRVQHFDNEGKIIQESGFGPAILNYCKYQERCHWEVRNKLYELGCGKDESEEQISRLIGKGILNEERYAKAYAGGKFRMNHWGREKIKQQLKLRKISDYCIKKGLAEIEADDYEKMLEKLTNKKIVELKSERNQIIKYRKTYKYLVQKGYERDMVIDIINNKLKSNTDKSIFP